LAFADLAFADEEETAQDDEQNPDRWLGVILVGWLHHAGAFEWALLQKPSGPQHVACPASGMKHYVLWPQKFLQQSPPS
jgi:hypothetical protein